MIWRWLLHREDVIGSRLEDWDRRRSSVEAEAAKLYDGCAITLGPVVRAGRYLSDAEIVADRERRLAQMRQP